ncbi:RNA polymerase sporulation sigma factor SigE [Ammonifex thiophilus]|uniref:RNA polymerase sigma factor n=1 Tax=Ammonifex thiophilus TaxID=444093 RepID=A0A3D8P496_9THEO|nr:RNA polymerase sporulation sigma factor SigE [Ammonifex thiophilus]
MQGQLLEALKLRFKLWFCLWLLRLKPAGFYVGGPEALPPPLNAEEEARLLRRLEAGDQSVRNTLVERNLRLVVYIARKYESTGINLEDLVSIGSIGLIKAVNTFNPQRKVKLATYASRCIENEILMFLRRQSRTLRQEVSFDEPLNTDWDGNELLLSDVLGTEGDVTSRHLEEEVDRKILKLALASLSGRERVIMELRFGLGADGEEKTQKEVADLLGISQSYISRLEKRILKRLRREICRLA